MSQGTPGPAGFQGPVGPPGPRGYEVNMLLTALPGFFFNMSNSLTKLFCGVVSQGRPGPPGPPGPKVSSNIYLFVHISLSLY